MDWFFRWVQNTRFWVWFSRTLLPYVNFRMWGYPHCSMMQYYPLRDLLRDPVNKNKFYVFAGVDRSSLSYKLNHLVTKCKFSHTGLLYLDEYGEVRIRHVIASGYEDWSFLSYLREVDYFEVFELPVTPENRARANLRIQSFAKADPNIGYDFSFELSDDLISLLEEGDTPGKVLLYCSEYVYLIGAGLTMPDLKAHWEFGRKAFEPDDVSSYCTPVSISDPLPAM
jgi:hypothetical protein